MELMIVICPIVEIPEHPTGRQRKILQDHLTRKVTIINIHK